MPVERDVFMRLARSAAAAAEETILLQEALQALRDEGSARRVRHHEIQRRAYNLGVRLQNQVEREAH